MNPFCGGELAGASGEWPRHGQFFTCVVRQVTTDRQESDLAKFWGISWGTFLPHLGKLGRRLAAWAALEPPCRLDQKYPKPPCRDDQNPLA